jgi:hypothetical protein
MEVSLNKGIIPRSAIFTPLKPLGENSKFKTPIVEQK